jgi:hypothetical protein
LNQKHIVNGKPVRQLSKIEIGGKLAKKIQVFGHLPIMLVKRYLDIKWLAELANKPSIRLLPE